jgi:hypothetical protein
MTSGQRALTLHTFYCKRSERQKNGNGSFIGLTDYERTGRDGISQERREEAGGPRGCFPPLPSLHLQADLNSEPKVKKRGFLPVFQ